MGHSYRGVCSVKIPFAQECLGLCSAGKNHLVGCGVVHEHMSVQDCMLVHAHMQRHVSLRDCMLVYTHVQRCVNLWGWLLVHTYHVP